MIMLFAAIGKYYNGFRRIKTGNNEKSTETRAHSFYKQIMKTLL